MKFARHIRLQTCEELLTSLAGRFENAKEGDVYPYVGVYAGGQYHTGIPVKLDTHQRVLWLALIDQKGGIDGRESLTYVPMTSISAVSLLNVREHVGAVTEGTAWSVNAEDAPSKLSLERLLPEIKTLFDQTAAGAKAVTIDWGVTENDPVARVYLSALLRACQDVFLKLLKDPLGAEAFKSVDKIILGFVTDQQLSVEKRAGELHIIIGSKMDINNTSRNLLSCLETKL